MADCPAILIDSAFAKEVGGCIIIGLLISDTRPFIPRAPRQVTQEPNQQHHRPYLG